MCGGGRCGCDSVCALVRDLFCASAVTCALWALHRIARGTLLQARVETLDQVSGDLQDEERAVIVSRIARDAMRF